MTVRGYALVSSIVFLLVAVLHLLRLVFQWRVLIGDWSFPMWASILALVMAGFLSYAGFRIFRAQRISLFR